MSRVAGQPVELPSGVECQLTSDKITVKGPKGTLSRALISALVTVEQKENVLHVAAVNQSKQSRALAGTTRANVYNLVTGVHTGFVKELELRGVGYRAAVKGKVLELTLGYSHPVNYPVPEGITIETPSATAIKVSGCSKEQVGQVAAEIREKRLPECYKGKGVRYVGENVILKDAKKK